MAGKPIPEEVVAQLCDRMLTAAIGKDWRKRAPEAVTAFWMGEVREALQEVAPALTAAQQQAVATPLPGDKGSVQALFNPTLQPMQQGGGEINMDVTVRDGAWVGTYAEWCRRKQDTPPSAPVGVEAAGITATELGWAMKRATPEQVIDYLDDDVNMRVALEMHFEDKQPAAVVDDTRRIRALADNYWRLEPFDMPTPGGDDADVGWRVIEFHRAEPRERVVVEHYRDNPREAIDAALAAQRQEPKS